MDYYLVQEFRERLIERYDPVTLVELLDITTEELWEFFPDRCLNAPGLAEDLGLTALDDDT